MANKITRKLANLVARHVPEEYNRKGVYICDPCAGRGLLLSSLIDLGFRQDNMFAYDEDEHNVRLLRDKGFIGITCNILSSVSTHRKFDIAITNIPYNTDRAIDIIYKVYSEYLMVGGRFVCALPERFFSNKTPYKSFLEQDLRDLEATVLKLQGVSVSDGAILILVDKKKDMQLWEAPRFSKDIQTSLK